MNKNSILFKKFFMLAFCMSIMLAINIPKASADIIQIGDGSLLENYYGPFNSYWGTTHMEYLFTADEIAAAGGASGIINSIAAEYVNSSSNSEIGCAAIYMLNAPANTAMIAHDFSDMTLVYENTSYAANDVYPIASGRDNWGTIELTTPFNYTGGDLFVKFFKATLGYFSGLHFYNTSISGRSIYGISDADNYVVECGTTLSNATNRSYRPNFRFDMELGPTIESIAPIDTIFAADPFVGDRFTPNVVFKRKAADPSIQLQYIIRDNAGNIVFEARDPNNISSNWINVPTSLSGDDPINYTFTNAVGTRVDNTVSPSRISFRSSDVRGGYYTVEARIRYIKDSEEKINEKTGSFEVLFNLDAALTEIREPFDSTVMIYPLISAPIRFQTVVKNVGKNVFRNFDLVYKVTNVVTNAVVYDSTFEIRFTTDIVKDQEYLHEISDFNPAVVSAVPGVYKLEVDINLVNQNEIPLIDNYIEKVFKIDYPYDGEVKVVEFPTETSDLYTDQPYFPKVVVANNSAFSASGVPLRFTIRELGTSTIVYDSTELIEELPLGGISVNFESYYPFIITEAGDYTFTVAVDNIDDFNNTNNEKTIIITVKESMKGDYTVGYNDLDPDFLTIEEALEAVYIRGVKDTVNFILVDPIYNVGDLTRNYALDISSAVAGFDNKNDLIRFVPSEELRYVRNSININFTSKTGIGMYFGSALTNGQFPVAPANRLNRSLSREIGKRQKDFYGFNMRLEIDGGANQAIGIGLASNLPSNVPNRISIMMAQGTNNVAIKNCILRGISLTGPQIPSVLYDAKFNTFTFDTINKVSAAVLLRNVLPVDHNGVNSQLLDTILISNINIENNRIEGGSFGIISLGIGPIYNVNAGYYVGYYNTNNRIANNQMNSFDVAGIMLGYEKGTQILNNNIYLVGVSSNENNDVAGIMLGGFGKEMDLSSGFLGTTGYNNLGVTISGNEISKIYSNKDAYGIRIEQELNNFVYSQVPGDKYFANHNDSMDVFNNVIWDIKTNLTNYSGSRYGVRLFGSRSFHPANRFAEFTERRDTNYIISHTRIINNSIVLNEDDNRKINNESAYIGGVVLQDVDTVTMYNNAIAILDSTNTSDIVSAVVIQSIRPNTNGTKFDVDNNIYYTPDMSVIRFIEQSPRQKLLILNPGARNQFVGLEQWVYLTNTDKTTLYTNFYSDLFVTKTNPQSLRINTPAPIGSYLNNRGKNFTFIPTDIYGNLRGMTDQDYDIGAWEFTGRAYENDCGFLNFISPVAARDYTHPTFQEAEYIMTTAPVDVIVNVRNNGSSSIRNKEITLQVYQINDATGVETLIGSYRTVVNAASSETKAIDFGIRQMDPLVFPKTYNELGLVPPARFRTMANNVSPRYRFKIILPSDQDTQNDTNSPQKVVRYYIKKSELSTIISADNTTLIPVNSMDVSYISGTDTNFVKWIGDNYLIKLPADMSKVAGYLNFKALEKGLRVLGFLYKAENGYDLMDRSAWEPNSLNYSAYRYMFWSDAVNDRLTEVQERDINVFMSDASSKNHKDIIFSSEEIARNSNAYYISIEENDFAKSLFGTTPKGNGIFSLTYEPNTNDNAALITGNTLLPNVNTIIKNTELTTLNPAKDVKMQPAVFENYGNGKLSALQAMYYTKLTAMNKAEKTFGLISFAPESNAIYLGVDWRNYDDPSVIISAILNHIGGFTEDEVMLPIELINFDANVANNQVLLSWETSSEVNTNSFVVERKNTNNFIPIFEVAAKGSDELSNLYYETDADVRGGNTYTYRLKSIDLDGSYSYSNEKSVNILNAGNFISLDKPTPNPATDNINVSFFLATETNIKLYITDITGKEVMVLVANQTFNGNNKLSFTFDNLANGNYNLILNANGNIVSQSFNIVK